MKYLVDTNAWLGFLQGEEGFGEKAREVMTYENWECVISVASIWEAAIKISLGKLKTPYDLKTELPGILEGNGFSLLPIRYEDAASVQESPRIHGDPFDRLQAVQAASRGLTIISRDRVFDAYKLSRIF